MEDLHEINLYQDKLFPFGIYKINREGSVPAGRGFDSVHWHEELQFTVVASGAIRMEINGQARDLQVGEGVFINTGVLHKMSALKTEASYLSFNFYKELVSFFQNSRMDISYVKPFTQLFSLPEIYLTKESPWQKEILDKLTAIYKVFFGNRLFGWEYQITILLSELWLVLIRNVGENQLAQIPQKRIDKIERIQVMLSYIHEHYQENLSLEKIALSANISVAECSRSFQEFVQTSPYKYLLEYRLEQSLMYLKIEKYSITEISQLAGFNQVAHFIQVFKRKYQMTPKKYQQKLIESEA